MELRKISINPCRGFFYQISYFYKDDINNTNRHHLDGINSESSSVNNVTNVNDNRINSQDKGVMNLVGSGSTNTSQLKMIWSSGITFLLDGQSTYHSSWMNNSHLTNNDDNADTGTDIDNNNNNNLIKDLINNFDRIIILMTQHTNCLNLYLLYEKLNQWKNLLGKNVKIIIYASEPSKELIYYKLCQLKNVMDDLYGLQYQKFNNKNNNLLSLQHQKITRESISSLLDKIAGVYYFQQIIIDNIFCIVPFPSGSCLGSTNWIISEHLSKDVYFYYLSSFTSSFPLLTSGYSKYNNDPCMILKNDNALNKKKIILLWTPFKPATEGKLTFEQSLAEICRLTFKTLLNPSFGSSFSSNVKKQFSLDSNYVVFPIDTTSQTFLTLLETICGKFLASFSQVSTGKNIQIVCLGSHLSNIISYVNICTEWMMSNVDELEGWKHWRELVIAGDPSEPYPKLLQCWKQGSLILADNMQDWWQKKKQSFLSAFSGPSSTSTNATPNQLECYIYFCEDPSLSFPDSEYFLTNHYSKLDMKDMEHQATISAADRLMILTDPLHSHASIISPYKPITHLKIASIPLHQHYLGKDSVSLVLDKMKPTHWIFDDERDSSENTHVRSSVAIFNLSRPLKINFLEDEEQDDQTLEGYIHEKLAISLKNPLCLKEEQILLMPIHGILDLRQSQLLLHKD